MEKIARMASDWFSALQGEFEKPYMKQLEQFLAKEIQLGINFYPPFEQVFNAFCYTPFHQVKVVIVGQDPYHGEGQAHGLSFSVPKGIDPPPSLKNIFKELKEDVGFTPPSHGSLIEWAKEGVFLLNATLTVEAGKPKSHYGQGWEQLTDFVVETLLKRAKPTVFLLWGKSAQEKLERIDLSLYPQHLILKAAHPSPFSAHSGFFGCKHFSKANQFLKDRGITPINWNCIS